MCPSGFRQLSVLHFAERGPVRVKLCPATVKASPTSAPGREAFVGYQQASSMRQAIAESRLEMSFVFWCPPLRGLPFDELAVNQS